MKKIFLLLGALVCLPLAAQSTLADRPVAIVKLHKTEVIPQSKYEQYIQVLQRQNQSALDMEQKKNILDIMINQMLVKQDATAKGIQITEENVAQAALQQLSMELQQAQAIPQGAFLNDMNQFRQLLNQQGMNPDLYLENIRNSLIIRQYIMQTRRQDFQDVPPASDQEIRSFYNGNISLFAIPEYVQIRQIFFSFSEGDPAAKKRAAQALMSKIESGQTAFAEAQAVEGDLFPMNQDRLQPMYIAQGDDESYRIFGPSFTDALFDNKTIGRPYLMESSVGMHIVVVDEWSEPGIRSLTDTVSPVEKETVKEFIGRLIRDEKQKRLYAQLQQEVVVDLRQAATEEGVRIFEDAIR